MNKEERTTCLVPTTMFPNKEAFMDLGFTFQVIPNSDLCLATLPEGWKSVASKEFWVNLIDENSYERGSYTYTSTFNNFMDLKTRFYLSIDFDPDDGTNSTRYVFVRDRTNGKVLFSAGSYVGKDTFKASVFSIRGKNFLNEHYPDWEDPTKYWDLEEKDIKYLGQ